MEVKIEPILLEQKSVFVQLMELCNYDFSVYEDTDVNEYGYFGYSHIDDYWNEKTRYPYFIRADGKLAGFVLVRENSRYFEGPGAYEIAEFFVMQKYRRKGVGATAARLAFDLHRGNWEVLQLVNNFPAQKFWKAVITDYTQGKYEECGALTEKWVGFLFNNKQ